jgi:hypothetical protein
VVRDLLIGQESSAFAVSWNGVWWSYTARSPAGCQRALLATDGVIQLTRAGHLALRGVSRVGLALVDSYAAEPGVAEIVAHKQDLLRIVDGWSGDGTFVVTVDRQAAARGVTARLRGKSLAEVLPLAGLAVIGALSAAVWR